MRRDFLFAGSVTCLSSISISDKIATFTIEERIKCVVIKMDSSTISLVYPVSKLAVYRGGYKVLRSNKLQGRPIRGDRKRIQGLSMRSLSNLVLTVQSVPDSVLFRSMLTLSYGPEFPTSVQKSKRNLDSVLSWLGRCFGEFQEYVWFMEFQKRGAIHYHVITTVPVNDKRRSMFAKYWVDVLGYQDWPYNRICDRKLFHVKQSTYNVAVHPGTWQELRSIDGAKRYITKYVTKPEQKKPPFWLEGTGRFWGRSDNIKLKDPDHIVDTDECELRQWLASCNHPAANWEYLPKILYKY